MTRHLIFLSIPGLRHRDIDRAETPTLFGWANSGAIAELTPTFPCVTSCVQASMLTGVGPARHGIIANGFYDRDGRGHEPDSASSSPHPTPLKAGGEVVMWTGWNHLVEAPQIWDVLRTKVLTTAVWHAQNIKGASADFIVTPAPIHDPDGSTKLWCYSKPGELYQQLIEELGHFPLQHYWGPLSNIESTRWILLAAAWLSEHHAPNFHWIYAPHLDYASQKFGPNSPQAKTAVAELDAELAAFAERIAALPIGKSVVFLAAGEYAMTDVSGVIYPNRILRKAGLLEVAERSGSEYLDLSGSAAFALVDHQFAHVYFRQPGNEATRQQVVQLFEGTNGIAGVYAGGRRAEIGMNHERSGDVILVCNDAYWLAYYWWLDDAKAPPFARTVDIHSKPGYDPVELYFDSKTRGIPLDATLVKGSHGAPATGPQHRTAMICSKPLRGAAATKGPLRDVDLFSLVQELLE